ncbi:hypothetical protein M427DRAFT_58171 [Gonapodya prolifera JEL478]|uniref:Uncharacterized protein n=1 Tax=Gonapodya prolifera (strain JEL478) TaxID=1344416 RepID=A0A139AAZ8_GONPJ|nr:hypothetical protein M427DRAFT_58171 [Gonapodya prolifera JEL478]|eukprot:KXS13917.1 hypothetical protein M427DRAFT_58171 [Gonapodya prolifera JEL478]
MAAYLADVSVPTAKRRVHCLDRMAKLPVFGPTAKNKVDLPPTNPFAFPRDNPYTYEQWKDAWHVDDREFFLMDRHKLVQNETKEDYLSLRRRQNRTWAEETTAQGSRLVKQKENDKAIRVFNHAIDIDPDYADAFVGRGCAYANTKRYRDAIDDFKRALAIDPAHSNAKLYLDETRNRSGYRDEDAAERATVAAKQAAEAALSKANTIPSQSASLVLRSAGPVAMTSYGLIGDDEVDEEGPSRPPPSSSKRRKKEKKDRRDRDRNRDRDREKRRSKHRKRRRDSRSEDSNDSEDSRSPSRSRSRTPDRSESRLSKKRRRSRDRYDGDGNRSSDADSDRRRKHRGRSRDPSRDAQRRDESRERDVRKEERRRESEGRMTLPNVSVIDVDS